MMIEFFAGIAVGMTTTSSIYNWWVTKERNENTILIDAMSQLQDKNRQLQDTINTLEQREEKQ